MSNDNTSIFRGMYESFAKGDVPTVLGMMDANVVWEESDAPGHPWGGKNHGPEGVLNKVFMAIVNNFDSFTVTPNEFVVTDDRVLAIGRVSGTAKATGKSFECDFVHIGTFKDGKLTRFQGLEDSAYLMSTLS